MSADELRRAAAHLRDDDGTPYELDEAAVATLADLLEKVALLICALPGSAVAGPAAEAFARAILPEPAPPRAGRTPMIQRSPGGVR